MAMSDVMRFSLFGITLFRERPGVISPEACWVCSYGGIPGWLHTNRSLLPLLWEVATEFRGDRHLVGY
jgi:hypothetical protein